MKNLWQLELAQLTRSGLARGLAVVFSVLVAYALWIGAMEQTRWANAVAANRSGSEEALAREEERVRSGQRNGFYPPGAPAAQKMDASLSPAPGVVLAVGDSALRPLTATVSTFSRADTLFKNTETASPLSAALGTLDMTWVVIVLMPLLVIALGHDVLAGERDAGRLGLLRMHAKGVGGLMPRRLVVHGSLPVLLSSAGALIAVFLGAPASVAGLWWLVTTLYLLVWILVTALISARARSSQSAAANLLMLWLGFVVVLPAALALAIERYSPVPSRLSQVIELREVELGLHPRTTELLDRYLVDHPELVGASRSGFVRSFFVVQRETESQLTPVTARFEDARRAQARLSAALSWLAPPMFVHSALQSLAGTDRTRHEAFVRQTVDFARQWREHLRERLFLDRNLTPSELRALPRFAFAEPRMSGRPWIAAGYLALLATSIAALLRGALRNADLR